MSETFRSQRFALHVLAAAILPLIALILFRGTLGGFWRGDDTYLMFHMLDNSMLDIFFSPDTWRQLSTFNLTPWVSLSLRVDYVLAGLDPGFYYVHHVLALGLVAVLGYLLLAELVDRKFAFGGALLFLLGEPVHTVSTQLMTRHYVEGLALSLACLYCHARFAKGAGRGYYLAGLACYVLAMTTKEIYVPLGVFVLYLIVTSASARVRLALPYLVAMVAYVAWRLFMLPQAVGGYSENVDLLAPGTWLELLATLLGIPAVMLGPSFVLLAPVFCVVLALCLWIDWRHVLPFALAVGLVALPLVPLVFVPGINAPDRYLLLPWYLFSFGFAYGLGTIGRRFGTGVRAPYVPATLLACLAAANLLVWLREDPYRNNLLAFHEESDVQLRFAWERERPAAYIATSVAASGRLVENLAGMKRHLDPEATIARAIMDEIFLDDAMPVYEYARDCRCMVDISDTLGARQSAWAGRLDAEAPLRVRIANNAGMVRWEFGPYASGTYYVVSEDVGNLAMPARQPGLRTLITYPIDFYLKYVSPEGWVTYSILLHLEADGEEVAWTRE